MRNLLSLVFSLGVVACVAPTAPDEAAQVGETSAELSSDQTSAQPAADTPDFTLSFLATCSGGSITTNANGSAVIGASAASCRRRNGTLTGRVSWGGFCTGDVANCNGNIACGC